MNNLIGGTTSRLTRHLVSKDQYLGKKDYMQYVESSYIPLRLHPLSPFSLLYRTGRVVGRVGGRNSVNTT